MKKNRGMARHGTVRLFWTYLRLRAARVWHVIAEERHHMRIHGGFAAGVWNNQVKR